MNAQTTFEVSGNGNLPATLANIEDFVDGRNRALELWLARYDTFHEMGDACDKASIAGAIGIRGDTSNGYGEKSVSGAFTQGPTQKVSRWDGEKRSDFTGREWFVKSITQTIDRRCWSTLMERLNFDRFLDRQAREEFHAGLQNEPPEFTVETVSATFGHLWTNRTDIWLRGLANTFMGLDRRFRSHDAFAIGNRIVIEYCFSDCGMWQNYNRRDTIRDVERIFRELDGKAPYGYDEGITKLLSDANRWRPTAATIEGEYFRARSFKNGNVHLWFTDKKLLAKVNECLIEYFKPVEGDVDDDGAPCYDSGPAYHSVPAKNFGEFFTNRETGERVIEEAKIADGMTVLEPSAGGGMLAVLARHQGGIVDCFEIQQRYADALAKVGFNAVCADFVRIEPARHGKQYDRIVMNPPFDRGRDCDHVRHAYQFLKPGGRLVAIMSARAEFAGDPRHKALHALVDECNRGGSRWDRRARWIDLPEKSFAHAGTNVNTVMLVLEKPQ